ncbi:MAG: RIO1 family regulatory kinase/ATPase [Chloroflexota bacterium]|nr:RIO1 family regulatory kinase/ATPase [Chloroflexota bacterium]
MSKQFTTDYDDYEDYGQFFVISREQHRRQKDRRNPRDNGRPVVPDWITEQIEGEDEFTPSFACSDSEQSMLREALGGFYYDNVITDVLARVKGGKEANVYCCRAHPATGVELIAAKIYRPRIHRTLRNDALYKEGRLMLDDQGKGIVRDARLKRAVARKTNFGKEVMTFSWIEHEYDMMETLHNAGADVPRPIAHVGSAILMEYFGEINYPAPTLNGVALDPVEAQPMFDRLLWHVELMLSHNRIHGDLSAYNVLYWEGEATVIDFPQAVVALQNRSANWLLQRDIERLCRYFARYDVEADHKSLTRDIWTRFMNGVL